MPSAIASIHEINRCETAHSDTLCILQRTIVSHPDSQLAVPALSPYNDLNKPVMPLHDATPQATRIWPLHDTSPHPRPAALSRSRHPATPQASRKGWPYYIRAPFALRTALHNANLVVYFFHQGLLFALAGLLLQHPANEEHADNDNREQAAGYPHDEAAQLLIHGRGNAPDARSIQIGRIERRREGQTGA